MLVCLLAAPAGLRSQDGGFEVRFGQLWMNVKGYDEHVGDRVRMILVQSNPPMTSDTHTRTPLLLNMDSGNTVQADVRFWRNNWAIGIRGWGFSAGDSFSGRVTSPVPTATPTALTRIVNTVSMWRETLPPVSNEIEPSGISPVDYRGEGGLDTYTADFFLARTLSGMADGELLLVFGAKLGQLDTDQSMGFDQRVFDFDFFSDGVHRNIFSTHETSAAASYRGVGPTVGLEADTAWRWLGIEVAARQAVLLGSSNETGRFSDIDDTTSTTDPAGPFERCTLALAPDGCVPAERTVLFSRSERRFVPVSELEFALEWAATGLVTLRGNAVAAIWTGAAVPPAFTLTHIVPGPGRDWESRRRTLVFGGIGLSVVLRP
jgi:hypothetical protein